MAPVKSSLIAAVGYDEAQKELTVEFKKGGTYGYKAVPHAVYTAMLEAVSVGSFFLRNVKGQYPTLKVI
jgi:plastocyanin